MLGEAAQVLRDAAREAGKRSAYERVSELLSSIREAGPSDEALVLLGEHRETARALGLSRELLDVLDDWRLGVGDENRRLEEVTMAFAIDVEAQAGLQRLERRGREQEWLRPLSIVAAGRTRALLQAIELAEGADWMVGEVSRLDCVAHAVSALLARHEFERARGVIERWREATARGEPTIEPVLLRLEAKAASYQDRFRVAVPLLQRAIELLAGGELLVEASYAKAELATVLARHGAIEEARSIVSEWPDDESPGFLSAYRHMARAELHLFAGESDRAFADAELARFYFESVGHSVLAAEAAFLALLGSGEERCRAALERFRNAVRQCPAARHNKRMAVVDALCAQGYRSLDDVLLVERTRYTETELPLFRAWVPRATAVEASIFWNRVRGTLYVLGTGPHRLDRQPMMRKLLEAVLSSPHYRVPIPELFERVWGSPYDPVRHENKVNVSLHRLRRWLKQHVPGSPALLMTQGGEVLVPPDCQVCVLSMRSQGTSGRLPVDAAVDES